MNLGPGIPATNAEEGTTRMVRTYLREEPACAMCHTLALPLGDADIAAGARWQCERCGQHWDAARLAKVAAYAAWDRARQARNRE